MCGRERNQGNADRTQRVLRPPPVLGKDGSPGETYNIRTPSFVYSSRGSDAVSLEQMALEQDQRISEVVKREQSRLRNFIRRRVPDPSDVEDIVQDVFYRLVEANRLLMPIEHVTGWLFRVARNRITDLFRTKKARRSRSKICCHRPTPVLMRSMSATCFLMSWNLRSTNCQTSSVKSSSRTNWKGAALRRWPPRLA